MDIEKLFDEVEDSLEEAVASTEVEIRRADETLVFWKGTERVGLEVPRSDVKNLYIYFEEKTNADTTERVINKVKQDSFHYLVLKYL